MALQTTYFEEADHLVATISGQWDEENALQVIKDVRTEAGRCEQTRVLLDVRGLLPPKRNMTRFFTGEQIAKYWGHPLKVAAVGKRELYTGFTEDVAINRGVNFRVFFEMKAAVEWLRGESA